MVENCAITCSGAKREAGQVESQIHELESAVSLLSDVVRRVEDRLLPVLRDVPANDANACSPQDYVVPIAEAIRSHRQGVAYQTNRLFSILDRIEL